jgi:hypothetical protein
MRAGFFPGVYRIVDEVLVRHQIITTDADPSYEILNPFAALFDQEDEPEDEMVAA